MKQDRINEIAAEFMPFLKGDNDAIARDPKRWHEEMTSWSAEEATQVVAALINKAVNEALEEAALHFAAMPFDATFTTGQAAAAVSSLKTLPQ